MVNQQQPSMMSLFEQLPKSSWGMFSTYDNRQAPGSFSTLPPHHGITNLIAPSIRLPKITVLSSPFSYSSFVGERMIASEKIKEELIKLFGHEKLEHFLRFVEKNIGPNAKIVDLFFVEELNEYAVDVLVPDREPDFDKLWRVGGSAEKLRRQLAVPFFLDFRFSNG